MLIPVDVGAAVESKPVPNGMYGLQITECVEAKSKAGNAQFVVSIGIEGHEDAPQVQHYVSLPTPGEDAKKMAYKALLLKRFLHLFKQPIPNAIDTEKMAMGMVGAKAKAELQLSEPDDNSRIYNRLQVPYLPDEGNKETNVGSPPKR